MGRGQRNMERGQGKRTMLNMDCESILNELLNFGSWIHNAQIETYKIKQYQNSKQIGRSLGEAGLIVKDLDNALGGSYRFDRFVALANTAARTGEHSGLIQFQSELTRDVLAAVLNQGICHTAKGRRY